MTLFLALLIIAAAVYLMVRQVEVRLVLLGAGLLMATVAGQPLAIADKFTEASVAAMVAPICAAMGFAAVLSLERVAETRQHEPRGFLGDTERPRQFV